MRKKKGHVHSLISTFVVHCLDSLTPLLAIYYINTQDQTGKITSGQERLLFLDSIYKVGRFVSNTRFWSKSQKKKLNGQRVKRVGKGVQDYKVYINRVKRQWG